MPSECRQRTKAVFCPESPFAYSLTSLGPRCAVSLQVGARCQSSKRPEWPTITLLFCWLSKEPRGPLSTRSLPSFPPHSPMQKLGPGRVGTGRAWLPQAMKVATGDLGEITSSLSANLQNPSLIPMSKPLLPLFLCLESLYYCSSAYPDHIHPLKPSVGPTTPRKPSPIPLLCTNFFSSLNTHCHLRHELALA